MNKSHASQQRSFSYLACVYGAISKASVNPHTDGRRIAKQCLEQFNRISNPRNFPPAVFILLMSPAYLNRDKADQLLFGIQEKLIETPLADAPMIGSSVGGIIFDIRPLKSMRS